MIPELETLLTTIEDFGRRVPAPIRAEAEAVRVALARGCGATSQSPAPTHPDVDYHSQHCTCATPAKSYGNSCGKCGRTIQPRNP